jgi:hypothetical protein
MRVLASILTIGVVIFVLVIFAPAMRVVEAEEQCPPCYRDRGPMPGHGVARGLPKEQNCFCSSQDCPGCSGDERRVIKIRFDTNPSTTWITGRYPDGGFIVDPVAYEAVKCAKTKWHKAVGSNGMAVHYFFVIDQNATDADIIIKKAEPFRGTFAGISIKSTPPYEMSLSPAIAEKSGADNCGRVAHELGHAMNAGGAESCGNSIMQGLNIFDNRYTNDVFSRDVDAVQRNFSDATRATCTDSYLSDSGEGPECFDEDNDGWTTCEGDCDDADETMNFDDTDSDELTTCEGDCDDFNAFVLQCSAGGACSNTADYETCLYMDHWHWNSASCECVPTGSAPDPVLIDVLSDGFSLTNLDQGVRFDFDGVGEAERLSWTASASDDAWLVLDRDGNGTIDNGSELIGNYTPQTPSDSPHGFVVLTDYDRPGKGGNADGEIDNRDLVYAALRLWQDVNHNGTSEPGELHSLSSLGVESISLDYRESRQRDRHGNLFRYRAKVNGRGSSATGKWAYDVFLLSSQ